MNKSKSKKYKYIYLVMLLFLLLHLCPITIVTCNKELNTCKCSQFFNIIMERKYILKDVPLNNIQQAVYYKEENSKNRGFFDKIYPGHGVGIELKEKQRITFRLGEKGDYIIPFYDTFSKTTTEKFIDNFNKYLEDENKKQFKDIHINASFIIFSLLISFIILF